MIRIARGDEPASLAPVRAKGLERLRAVVEQREAEATDFTGYDVVKDDLWRRQHFKCAFCESREQKKRNDVEHFRPKTRADRGPHHPAKHGYWWLAWNWKNLLFACRNCNQAPYKLDKFPLAAGGAPLAAGEQPPGAEKPLLLDPAVDCGADHIEFAFDATKKRWTPRARGGSELGAKTIEVCGLGRPELLDMYTDHVEREVEPRVRRVMAAAAAEDGARANQEWIRAVAELLAPSRVYAALARDALLARVDAATRERWQLQPPVLP